MAMNKAEKARLEELETALALHWPGYKAPQPMTREEIEARCVDIPSSNERFICRRGAWGWFYNAHTKRVTRGWSNTIHHNPDSDYGDNASQNMGRIYRTYQEAAMALRLELSRIYAGHLAAVDRMVRGESK